MTAAEAALAWLAKRRNHELIHAGYDAQDGDEWRVYKITGGRNDRKWTKVGSGPTALAALQDAMSKDKKA
jgi:hypothetical protein